MANYIYKDGELMHYGVLGMKWGRRRAQNHSAKLNRKATKRDWSEDSIDAAKIRTKSVKQMSNAELKRLNNRNQLEVTYRELREKQNRGKRAIRSFTKTAGTITAIAAAAAVYKKYGTPVVEGALDKIGDLIVSNIKF